MKKITNTILWYVVSGLWSVNLIIKLVSHDTNYPLIALTAFTLLASLACAIINHRSYLKEKNAPQDTDTDTDTENQ